MAVEARGAERHLYLLKRLVLRLRGGEGEGDGLQVVVDEHQTLGKDFACGVVEGELGHPCGAVAGGDVDVVRDDLLADLK